MSRSWLIAALILCTARPAAATYSIVATDQDSREVGGAGTSCVGGDDVYIIYRSVPGFGVVHAQALVNQNGRNRAAELLGDAVAPDAILDEITSSQFDPASGSRQYGIADVMGRTAGFTGNSTQDYAADIQGVVGPFNYSVQGNILTSAAVLTQASDAFEASGCDLAERLLFALEAGADNGEGDNRCTDDGIPSDSAYLQVDRPDEDAGDYLSLRVPTSGNDNPLIELRALYDDWRMTNPCPDPPDPGTSGAGGGTAGGGGSGGSGGAQGGSAGMGMAGSVGGAAGAGGQTNPGAGGSPLGSGGSSNGGWGMSEPPATEAGCACRASGSAGASSPAWLALGLLALGMRRRSLPHWLARRGALPSRR